MDALNPSALTKLGPELTPNFHRLMDEGASTLNARSLFEETETLPNHTGMLTGRRAKLPRGTGVRFNDDPGKTLRAVAGHYIAGVFDVVHDSGGSTALYTAKTKFKFFDRSWNARNGAKDKTGANNGRDKLDRFVLRDSREDRLITALDKQLSSSPATLSFLHLAAPDRAGHAYGGMSAKYLDAVEKTDAQLGQILATIDSHPKLKQHLLVVLTADHGTKGRVHDDARKLVNYRVPFIAWGPGVSEGGDLYALNPEFREPGKTRPSYAGKQPIRNGFIANLALAQLGLKKVPGSEFDVPRTLDLS